MDNTIAEKENIVELYVNTDILKNNLSIIDDIFLDDMIHLSEFGYTMGNEGIKVNLESWTRLLKPSSFSIVSKTITESSIMYNFLETATHIDTFKGIPASNKEIECKGSIRFEFKGDKVKKLFIKRSVSDIVMQLVDYNENEHNKLALQPMLSTPYDIPLTTIQQQFKSNDILLTFQQAQCLSGWLMFENSANIANLTQISTDQVDACLDALKKVFNCDDRYQLISSIEQPSIKFCMSNALQLMMIANHSLGTVGSSNKIIYWPDQVIHEDEELTF